ncbi:AraC family transcriptional regulator [uncultured Jannaschia sp.]|uniref:helix-turn-helix domain-containing protein n=1 Tax=uncultured Jannaschia sp. TaxID=293347 RepID=UPI002631304B|nr:AraC family transcriptional regulator [uncultured Jannaschia sp.]
MIHRAPLDAACAEADARAIEHIAARLGEPVSVDDLVARVGMSRAVFHRRFKEATIRSPIQFAKAMRLNEAAMRISAGTTVSKAAMEVGYASPSHSAASSSACTGIRRGLGAGAKRQRRRRGHSSELTLPPDFVCGHTPSIRRSRRPCRSHRRR